MLTFFLIFALSSRVFLNCYSITVVCIFYPSLYPLPQPNPPPSPTSTLPLDFVHVSFIVVPVSPSPHCPLPLPSGYLAIVRLFLTSMSLVIFCLFFFLKSRLQMVNNKTKSITYHDIWPIL